MVRNRQVPVMTAWGVVGPWRDAIILHEVRQRFSTLEFSCSITTGALGGRHRGSPLGVTW